MNLAPSHPTFREALRTWARIGLNSFGGPAGQIAVMHRVLIEEKRWIREDRFLHALNFCMFLPGPEATQLAIYVGWLLHGTRGGLAAGILFVLPGFCALLALSTLYVTTLHVGWVAALFFGIKCAVLAIVLEALVRIGKRALKSALDIALALASFAALFVFGVPFPLVVGAALVLGYAAGRVAPRQSAADAAAAERALAVDAIGDELPSWARPDLRRAMRVLATGLFAWFAPLALVVAIFGRGSVYAQQAILFSKAAVVTFGGAYAVLAYIGQQAVSVLGWLTPREMLDGLGLAETTPGPLILVLEFVGFVGAHRLHGDLAPLAAGLLGACVTVWATFVPCFLWVFVGAPWIEALRTNRALAASLSAVTAAVVGVIANLSAWFALHVLFGRVDEVQRFGMHLPRPSWSALDPWALAISAAAILAVFVFRAGLVWTLAGCALAGIALRAAGLLQ